MRVYHHVYRCELCELVFGVEEAYEEQWDEVCPMCNLSDWLEDLGYNEIIVVYEPSEEGVKGA